MYGVHRYGKDAPFYKHGESKIRLYRTWQQMKTRCYDSKSQGYKYCGGRGIKVCPEWKNNYIAFRDFALSHGYKDNLTIDRKDNNGNYEPSNCQFITRAENVAKANKSRKHEKSSN